jgi:large subunit ribosomal protein L13
MGQLGMLATKTYTPRPGDVERHWYVVDAQGQVLGRLASEVAKILRGKHKPIFAPHVDTGDHVIVVNAAKIVLTGGKENEKVYSHHSGYPGGLTQTVYARLLAERPSFAVERAVRGMIPKNRLGRQIMRKLSVYDGPEHRHAAQKPIPLGLGEVPPWTGLPAPKPRTPKRQREATVKTEEEAPAKTTSRKSSARSPGGASSRRSSSSGSRAKSAAGRTSSRSGSKGETTASTRKKRTEKES